MARVPSISSQTPSSSRPLQRRWFLAFTTLAVLGAYLAGGAYLSSFASLIDARPAFLPEVSVRPADSQAVATDDAATFPEPGRIAETSSIVVELPAGSQTGPLQADGQAAAPVQAASNAPPGPAAPPSAATQAAATVERWRAAGIIIVTEGQEWDAQTLANVDAALSLLPPSVRADLGNPALGQLHILVNTKGRALSGKQPYGGAANYFSTNEGVNELVLYPRQRVSTVLHELGHAYNLRRTPAGHYAKVLVDPEMESFLAATGWHVLTPRDQVARSVDHMRIKLDYVGTFTWPELSNFDPLEDFANSFAMYFYDPAGLKSASPERYNWMAANLPR